MVLRETALAFVLDQVAEQLGLHQRQRQVLVAARAAPAARSRSSGPANGVSVGRLALPLRTAQQPADARDENGQLERLRQVVVRAGLEPVQHVLGRGRAR